MAGKFCILHLCCPRIDWKHKRRGEQQVDLKALQETLKIIAAERQWAQVHTPKNLSMALMVEAAELMELFQWKTPEESFAPNSDPALQSRVGEELADVLLYLVQLVDQTGVDLQQAVHAKLLKNAEKYAVQDAQAIGAEVQKAAQTHVLVDWENVQPKDVEIRALVPDVTHVWIFHGPTQTRAGAHQQSFGDGLTLVPVSRSGKNALDFLLSYYVGYISSRNPNARFVVVSNDQGYGPMLDHAKELGFAASQLGFKSPKAAAKKKVAKKAAPSKAEPKKSAPATKAAPAKKAAPVKKPPAAKKSAQAGKSPAAKKTKNAGATPAAVKKAASAQPKAKAPGSKPSTSKKTASVPVKKSPVAGDEKDYLHALSSLKNSKNKPAKKARLYGAVKSFLGAETADDARVERVVQRLITDGHLVIEPNGAVTKTP